jgi:hypothetical protein
MGHLMWPQAAISTDIMWMLATQDDFERRARFEYSWSLWPRRCYRSQRWVWGLAIEASAVWTGPGDPVVDRRWLHRDEGVIMLLKGVTNGTV